MPVYLKRWYLRKLLEVKKKEKTEHDKAMNKGKGVSRPRIPNQR